MAIIWYYLCESIVIFFAIIVMILFETSRLKAPTAKPSFQKVYVYFKYVSRHWIL